MKDVYQVVSPEGGTLAMLTSVEDANRLSEWTTGTVARLTLFDNLEDYVVALTRQTTIAEEINLRRGLGLVNDTNQIIERRARDNAIGAALLEPQSIDEGLVHPILETFKESDRVEVFTLSESMARHLVVGAEDE